MDLIPCSVVVDSRNVHGQVRRSLGFGGSTSVAGVRCALRAWGLDAQEIFIGAGTRGASTSVSKTMRDVLGQNAKLRDQWIADGAHVLDGVLVERARGIEEKQVDVLCALKVVDLAVAYRGRLVVLLSEDMDLLPACVQAEGYGAPAAAAATRKVNDRSGLRRWMLLDLEALSALVGDREQERTLALRGATAVLASQPGFPSLRWRYVRTEDGEHHFRSNKGIHGVLLDDTPPLWGEKRDLHACGVRIDPRFRELPQVLLSSTPGAVGQGAVVPGSVMHWRAPDRVSVNLGTESVALHVPAGEPLLPGQRVAVLRNSPKTHNYIGALHGVPAPIWLTGSRSALGVAVGDSEAQGGQVVVQLDDARVVSVQREQIRSCSPGERVRVFITGRGPDSVMSALPLSSGLPIG